jgi:hypothetical protein
VFLVAFIPPARSACSDIGTGAQQPTPTSPTQDPDSKGDDWVFADFDHVQDGRPVSNAGGFIALSSYEESPSNKSRYSGQPNMSPPAPELVHIKPGDPNRAATFQYWLAAPNRWAGVILDVHGNPDKDGKPVPDDVSGYKNMTIQAYVTGVQSLRVEFVSRGVGLKLDSGFPQLSFRVQPGFNTYKIEFSKITQPSYIDVRRNPKEFLRKLTAVQVAVSCNDCTPINGMVVVDNIIFHKK